MLKPRRHLLLVVMGSVALRGLSSFAWSAPTITASSTLVSDYIFRGLQLGGASLQPTIEFNADHSVAGIAASIPLDGSTAMQPGAELDFYASHHFALSPQAQATIGAAAYFYRDAPTAAGFRSQVFEPSLGLNYAIAGIRIASTCYYDVTRKGPTFELGAAIALPLRSLGTEIDFAATAGRYRLHDTSRAPGPGMKLAGTYWLIDASIPFQINATSKITAGLAYTGSAATYLRSGRAPQRDHPLAAQRLAVRLGYSYTF